MTLRWLLLGASELPNTDDWLSVEERTVLSGLTFPKRRSEWALGRCAAKRALRSVVGAERLAQIEIVAAKDGAPEVFVDRRRREIGISISHREGVAACVVDEGGPVGCDLEAIESRTSRFVNDFFTETERLTTSETPGTFHERHVALIWSAKESALKFLRVGLRRDTRSVEVRVDNPLSGAPSWGGLQATVQPEGRTLHGWWRQAENLVFTVIAGAGASIDESSENQ
ncbi:MAG: 4'-phosphopantetheinyl transferase family protein [Polyangiales bacterium]